MAPRSHELPVLARRERSLRDYPHYQPPHTSAAAGGQWLEEYLSELSEALADLPRTSLCIVARKRDATRLLLERCIDDKLMAPPADMELALDLIFGPLFYRLLMGHAPITRSFVDRLIDTVIPASD